MTAAPPPDTPEPAAPRPGAGPSRRFIVGVSGASGAIYAVRLIEALLRDPSIEVHATATQAGLRVLRSELDPVAEPSAPNAKTSAAPGAPEAADAARSPLRPYLNLPAEALDRLVMHNCADIGAGPASGTYPVAGMVVVPCSMNTLAAAAHGLSTNLLTRACAVTLKEGRPLVLVPRETPFTLIDMRNMTALAEAGAIILPANPGFYHRPQTIEDVVRYVVQKILDRLGVAAPDAIRWGENLR